MKNKTNRTFQANLKKEVKLSVTKLILTLPNYFQLLYNLIEKNLT